MNHACCCTSFTFLAAAAPGVAGLAIGSLAIAGNAACGNPLPVWALVQGIVMMVHLAYATYLCRVFSRPYTGGGGGDAEGSAVYSGDPDTDVRSRARFVVCEDIVTAIYIILGCVFGLSWLIVGAVWGNAFVPPSCPSDLVTVIGWLTVCGWVMLGGGAAICCCTLIVPAEGCNDRQGAMCCVFAVSCVRFFCCCDAPPGHPDSAQGAPQHRSRGATAAGSGTPVRSRGPMPERHDDAPAALPAPALPPHKRHPHRLTPADFGSSGHGAAAGTAVAPPAAHHAPVGPGMPRRAGTALPPHRRAAAAEDEAAPGDAGVGETRPPGQSLFGAVNGVVGAVGGFFAARRAPANPDRDPSGV